MTLQQAEYLGCKTAFIWAMWLWLNRRLDRGGEIGETTAFWRHFDYMDARWPQGPHVTKVAGIDE